MSQWVDSYLDALLRTGAADERSRIHGAPIVDADRARYAQFYVQQILALSEDDIRKAWAKANATSMRNISEPSHRLAYLTWRVWTMRSKRNAVQAEEARMSAGEADSSGALTVLPFPFEDEPPPSPSSSSLLALDEVPLSPRQSADGSPLCLPLYLVMISLHGLVRGEELELGRDADTGGQVKYVVELARALADMPGVHRVDLLTRLISDPCVDASYGVAEERLSANASGGGAYIIRLGAGSPDVYLRKELLWPHLREFADRTLEHVTSQLQLLEDAGVPCRLVNFHGHYADGSEVAALCSSTLGLKLMVTAHSLGRNKLSNILRSGKMTRSETEAQYRIGRRIEAEERCLDSADVIFTSTREEILKQWSLYDGYSESLANALLVSQRATGRHMPRMVLCPPGLDFSWVRCFDPESPPSSDDEPPIWRELSRFLRDPRKPCILAIARPDAKKNFSTLLRAFGESPGLRELTNLVIVAGNRDSVEAMSTSARLVMEAVLKDVDRLDLYGICAIPKHHEQSEVTALFGYAASTHGVFVNVALQEPFGLTLIEAAAHGVPMVATRHGGPFEIHQVLQNGILVEPTNTEEIAEALLTLVTDRETWDACHCRGLERIHDYAWPAHCQRTLSVLSETVRDQKVPRRFVPTGAPVELQGGQLPQRLLVVTMDSRDAHDCDLLRCALSVLHQHGLHAAIVVSSTLSMQRTQDVLTMSGIDLNVIDALIVDAGASIALRSGGALEPSSTWASHAAHGWLRPVVHRALMQVSAGALVLSPEPTSPRMMRLALAPGATAVPALHVLKQRLRTLGVRINLHYSAGGAELVALPLRASRSLAMRFLAVRLLGIPLASIVVLASQAAEPDGDRAEVMAGLCQSMLIGGEPPPTPRTAERQNAPALAVSTDAVCVAAANVHRTTWLDDIEQLGDALKRALTEL